MQLQSSPQQVSGGGKHTNWYAESTRGPLFVKIAPAEEAQMFAAEFEGLAELAASETVQVSTPCAHGRAGPCSFIMQSWLPLRPTTAESDAKLGRKLAQMHRATNERFGWHRDNTIGLTPQINTPGRSWHAFYVEHRIGYQLELAASNGLGPQRFGRSGLLAKIEVILSLHTPPASLLHGDLWSGNKGRVGDQPVIFDPAVYYGDRETDLAMTQLFGGFDGSFYHAYQQEWPLPAGHQQRLPVYQLYHWLNHLNLFGATYLDAVENCIQAILAVD